MKGHAGGLRRATRRHVAGERSLERIDRLIGNARPPGGFAHQLEVVRHETPFAIGGHECLERLLPGMAAKGVLPQFERT